MSGEEWVANFALLERKGHEESEDDAFRSNNIAARIAWEDTDKRT